MSDKRPWALWAALSLIAFGAIEAYALIARRVATLSATVWALTKRHPLLPFALGLVVGALAIHFFGWTPECPS